MTTGFNPVSNKVVDLDGQTSSIIGYLVRFKKGSEMILVNDMRAAMRDNMLDESLVHDIRVENAMKKTVAEMKKKKMINEIKSDNKDVILFQFDEKIVEQMPEGLRLKFQRVANLTFDIKGEKITCDPDDQAVIDEAYERFGIRKIKMDKAQFTVALNRVIEETLGRKLVRIDDGWFFFDNSVEAKLRSIIKMVKQCDQDAEVLLIPQVKTVDNVKVAVDSTNESYSNLIQIEIDKLEKFKIQNDGKVTEKFGNNMRSRLDDLMNQGTISLLQLEAKIDLIKDAHERAKKLIDSVPVEVSKKPLTPREISDLTTAKKLLDKGVSPEEVNELLKESEATVTVADLERLPK